MLIISAEVDGFFCILIFFISISGGKPQSWSDPDPHPNVLDPDPRPNVLDPDPRPNVLDPDPHTNVLDPQHCIIHTKSKQTNKKRNKNLL